jgi:hypothetical protein
VGVSGNALPASTGDGFAAPGKALQQAGQQVSAFALQLQKQEEDLGTFEVQRGYQEFVNERDRYRREADAAIEGDGRGHADRLDAEDEQAFGEFRTRYGHIPPRARERVELQWGRDRNRFSNRSFGAQQRRIEPFYIEQSDNHFTANIQPRLFQRDEHGVLIEPRLDSIRRGSAMVDQWLDGAAGLPPTVRENIRRSMARRMYDQWLSLAGPEAAAERAEVIKELELNRQRDPSTSDMPLAPETPGGPERTSRRPRGEAGQAIVDVAGSLGIRPEVLAGLVHFETGGSMRADQRGGSDIDGGRAGQYRGLIQFSPENQTHYGVRPGMSFREQLEGPVARYLQDRFREAGIDIRTATTAQIYASVLAGNPRATSARDFNGTRADRAVADIERRGQRWLRGAGGGDNVVLAQSSTEDRVRQMIIDNAVQVDEATRRARVRADAEEGRSFRRFRDATENTLLDRALMTRQMRERGDSDEAIREAGGITTEELRSYVNIVRRPFYDRVHTILHPRETGVRISEPGLFSEMLSRARASGGDGATPPQVVMDEAQEAFIQRRMTSDHLRIILDTARRNVNENTATPRWVSDHFLTLRNALVPRGRRMNEAESRAFDEANQRLNSYVNEYRQAGKLDNKAMGEFTTSLIQGRQQSQIDDTLGRLRTEPRPSQLTVPIDQATLPHVDEAMTKLRQELEQATQRGIDEPTRQRLSRQAQYLLELKEVLIERERLQTGHVPPPTRSGGPSRGGGGQPGDAFDQFPPRGNIQLDRDKPPGERSQAPAQPSDGELVGRAADRIRTFRRIIRNPETNEIEGIEDAPLP